jgi:hypothetical protein
MADENNLKKLASFAEGLEPSDWDEIPDIGLYMDQVTGLLNRMLSPFTMGRDESPLTPSMINNYVKSGHISRPTRKKYSREQLAALCMLCSLKGNLSITDSAALIYFLTEQEGASNAYNRFAALQKESLMQVDAQLASLPDEPDVTELTELALEMAQTACVARLAAEAVISYLIMKDDANMARRRAEAEAAFHAQEENARAKRKSGSKRKKKKAVAKEE